NTDTGSPEAQIALFSYRIAHLTEHLKSNHKDYSTERGIITGIGIRSLIEYLLYGRRSCGGLSHNWRYYFRKP
ncbi:30S ribosomal protein S15, partial [Megasphaera sp.]|uniref:30S ribosomal protein S15 n=1 Tax=Megasphaera sp. TaxID=2023260 RepID=UPI003AB2B2BF